MDEAELLAQIADLEASLDDCAPEMRSLLASQIETLRGLLPSLRQASAAMAEQARLRRPLSPEEEAFFRPEPPAPIPTWIADHFTRSQVTREQLNPAPGCEVFIDDDWAGCSIPVPGSVPVRHGLQLSFYQSGALRDQSYYEHGLMRWSITYHASGGRDAEGFYADVERLEHLEHGLHTRRAPGGRVVAQSWYQRGKLHGWSRLWEADGFPVSATLHVEGKPTQEVLPGLGTRPL